jgi:hypothetical protein
MSDSHENLRRHAQTEGSSDRSFGLVFGVFFLVIALLPLWHGASARYWALMICGFFLVIALTAPTILAPLNRLWTKLGLLLGNIVSPIALGILFYGVVATTGLVMRLLGKDPLRLKFDRKARTYWIERDPPGPTPQSLDKQF